jgi:hypothetical protein
LLAVPSHVWQQSNAHRSSWCVLVGAHKRVGKSPALRLNKSKSIYPWQPSVCPPPSASGPLGSVWVCFVFYARVNLLCRHQRHVRGFQRPPSKAVASNSLYKDVWLHSPDELAIAKRRKTCTPSTGYFPNRALWARVSHFERGRTTTRLGCRRGSKQSSTAHTFP